MIETLGACIVVLVVLVSIYKLQRVVSRGWLYTYDPNNPYRRYCKLCRQQQDQHEYGRGTCWEAMRDIKDPSCICHEDVV